MNKAAAEIIAGLIPNKMARNRWRGILRYGLTRLIGVRREIKYAVSSPPPHYLAACAIAKDEGPYFREWIEWHLSQGVEKFYIYDNGSTDNTKEILEPYIAKGIVDYRYYPGYRKQIAAYDDCMTRHRLDANWIAFIDLDEFIVPVKDSDIPSFLHKMEDFSAVEINWLVYGSGGAREKGDGDVMERFRKHSLPGHRLNRHVKSIVNPLRTVTMTGCHEAALMEGQAADSHGNPICHNFREREPRQDVIRINHYAIKSYDRRDDWLLNLPLWALEVI